MDHIKIDYNSTVLNGTEQLDRNNICVKIKREFIDEELFEIEQNISLDEDSSNLDANLVRNGLHLTKASGAFHESFYIYEENEKEYINIEEFGPKQYFCGYCRTSFLLWKELLEHICTNVVSITKKVKKEIYDKKNEFTCTICSVTLSTKANLERHLLIHSGEKPHKCEYCQKAFSRLDRLKDHKKKHNKNNPFQCSLCLIVLSSKVSLERHLLLHSGEKRYQCKSCLQAFIRLDYLKRHMKTHIAQNKKPVRRSNSSVGFNRNGISIKDKGISKEFNCSQCKTNFHLETKLLKHICPKAKSITEGTVQINEYDAVQEKFCCAVCSALFTKKGNLERHQLIHSGVKPYKCKYCSRAFSRHDTLKTHTKTHTN